MKNRNFLKSDNIEREPLLTDIIPGMIMLLLVSGMVGASVLFRNKEIIFPEITALTIGSLITPRRIWRVSNTRMIFLIGICAVLGVCIVKYVPGNLWIQIMLAFCIAQFILSFSKTTMAPLISALVLPVVLQTDTWIYPVSAVVMTTLIVLSQQMLVYIGVRNTEIFYPAPYPKKKDLRDIGVRIIVASVLTFVFLSIGWKFSVSPPLLVLFQELSNRNFKARKMPGKTIAILTACAAIGAFGRLILTENMGISLMITAVLVSVGVLVVMRIIDMFLPPAGALAILPMLISADKLVLYPLQILIGSVVLMGCALIFFPSKE